MPVRGARARVRDAQQTALHTPPCANPCLLTDPTPPCFPLLPQLGLDYAPLAAYLKEGDFRKVRLECAACWSCFEREKRSAAGAPARLRAV